MKVNGYYAFEGFIEPEIVSQVENLEFIFGVFKVEEIHVSIDFQEEPTQEQIRELENIGVRFTGTGVPVPDYSLDAIITSDVISKLEEIEFIKRVWSYTGRGAGILEGEISSIKAKIQAKELEKPIEFPTWAIIIILIIVIVIGIIFIRKFLSKS